MSAQLIMCGVTLLGISIIGSVWLVLIRTNARIERERISAAERNIVRARAERIEKEGWRGVNADLEQKINEQKLQLSIYSREIKRCHAIMAKAGLDGKPIRKEQPHESRNA